MKTTDCMFEKTVAMKQTPKAIPLAMQMPTLSFDIQITNGRGRYALPRTRLCISISHDKPAAMYADTLTNLDFSM